MVNCTFFLLFFSMRRAAEFCMRRWLWTEEAGRPERRELQQSRRDRMSEVTIHTRALTNMTQMHARPVTNNNKSNSVLQVTPTQDKIHM